MRRLAAVFKRDKHHPPPLVTDHAHSSASSSSGSTSLCLQTPDDDQQLTAAVDRQSSKRSWRSWLKSSSKKPLPEWTPSHDVDDLPSEPSIEEEPRGDPIQPFTILVKNSLQPPPPPAAPFSHRADVVYIFPKSVNLHSSLPRSNSLAAQAFKRRLLNRLQDETRPFIKSELGSIAPLASRRIEPVVPVKHPHPFNESAPSKTTSITPSCPGLTNWVSRPCFEDRYDLFITEQDGTISRRPVIGSNLAVAALEFSEFVESMVDFDSIQSPAQLVNDIPHSETLPNPPLSSGHSRNSPYIAVPSPLRNEHNHPPPSPSISVSQSAPPAVPTSMDPLVKRGVRFAEDGKDDVIPLGYVLRMKKKREEKAKFLKAEQERRLLEEERMRIEEERRKQAAERAEWEAERRAWEKEKRAMEEERRQRKYADEVVAARLRRESQRAGGVPGLKTSESNAYLVPNSGAGYFPASASSSTSERNKSLNTRRHSRPAYDDGGTPVYLPRREASEPNLPTRISTNSHPPVSITPSPRDSFTSHSGGSSRPPSINKDTPTSMENSSPLLGTPSPSVYSSQEVASSSEDVKAAVAAAAKRTKRNSFAASISASRNNSNTSLSGDRATSYPVWTGSSHSLNSMVPPVPMMPMQMQMLPMPQFVMMDMPLLPPTPPFMMQQYPRQHGSPGSSGSGGGGSLKGRLGGSQNSSREQLGSQNSSRERVNVIGGRSGSAERGNSEGRGPQSRSSSFSRPEAPRHQPSSPVLGSSSGSPYGHTKHSSSPGPSSRRASMPVSPPPQSYNSQKRARQSAHEVRPPPPTHAQSQPTVMQHVSSTQHLQQPSPWTGVPTQSGKLPNGNSNGGGNGSRGHPKTVPPRHMSYSGVRSEGMRMSNMRTEPPRQAKRQTMIS